MKKNFVVPLALAIAGAPALLRAEPADSKSVETVVVASRVEQKVDEVLAPVTVLTRADIERLQPSSLVELIAQIPGVDFSRSGGAGASANLYLRGTNKDHTLVLVDGQRISSATLGTTDLQFIDPAQIERIEVVRGPRSSLYGADAIGGVIQIFTRRASGQPSAYVSAGYGAYRTHQAAAGGQGKWEQLRYSANVSHYYTEGFNNTTNKKPFANDDDGYRNASVNASLGYDFANGAKLDLDHFYTRTRNEYDGTAITTEPYAEGWIQSDNLTLRAPVTDFWHTTLSTGRSIDDTDNYDRRKASTHTFIRTTRSASSWQNDFTWSPNQTFTLGVDYLKDRVDNSTALKDADGSAAKSRDNTGYFAQYLLTGQRIELQAGIREDHNEAFADKTTGNVALGFKLPKQHRLVLSYGTAFKAPTFNQLYYPGYGNADLQPEFARNYEIELRGDYTRFEWSLNIFENQIDNLIQTIKVAPGISLASNVQKAKIRGGELVTRARLDQWLISGSISYVDPRNDDTGKVLTNGSRRSLKLDVDRAWQRWSVGASFRAQDSRYIDVANTSELGGYGLLDLRTAFKVTEALQLQLKMTNVFAKHYELNNDYNTERFGWLGSAVYRW